MRLYFKEVPEYLDLNIQPEIEQEQHIYSNDGIYIIKQNELYNLDIKEHEKGEELNYIDVLFIVDNTEYTLTKTFTFPNMYKIETINKEIYDLESIQLIVEKQNNVIYDAYIEIKDKHAYKECLSTLLLKIK